MPSTYTTNLGLEKPATGEQAGVWGKTANLDYDFLDTATDGSVNIPLPASTYTLLTTDGQPSLGRNKVITFTGALTADGSVLISPLTAQKIYFVTNHTTGGFAITFSQGTGPTFKLSNGYSAVIFSDGLAGTAGVRGALADLQVNSLLVLTNLTVQGQISWSQPAVFNQPVTFQGLATMQAGATISAPLTLALGGDAPYDMYYRSAAGPVARLPQGSVGQVLTSTVAGPSWATLPAQVPVSVGNATIGGSGVTGVAAGLLIFGNQNLQLGQSNILSFDWGYPGLAIGKQVDRQGLIVGAGVNSSIYIEGAAASGRNLFWNTAGVNRWLFTTTGDAESGGNHGCTLYLQGYNDNGLGAISNIAFFRIGGRVTFGQVNDLSGAAQVAILGVLTNQVTLYVRGCPGQTANLQQWLDAGGNVVASLDINGHFTARGGYT